LVSDQDTMNRNGELITINTMHQCITEMREYNRKSLEELRFEDYQAKRKFLAFGTGGLFCTGETTNKFGPTSTATTSGGLFGSAKPLFGSSLSTTTTMPASTSLLGAGTQKKSDFSAPTTTTSTISNPFSDSVTFHYIKYSHEDVKILLFD